MADLGSKVWVTITDLKTRKVVEYLPAEVVRLGITKEYATVKFQDGRIIDTEGVDPNSFHLLHIALRTTEKVIVSDLISMEHINEPEIARALKNRYETEDTYTYCGETLISTNPNRMFSERYQDEKKQEYKIHLQTSFLMMQKLPPHIYSIALAALHEVIYDERPERNLSLCFTGESGSGKTVAAKHALEFLMYCYNESPAQDSIEFKVYFAKPGVTKQKDTRGIRPCQDHQ